MATCSRGWATRCPGSKGRKCRCACGGQNHGERSQSRQADERRSCAARFRIESLTPEHIVIRDVGPWTEHPTVTNDAEGVIRALSPAPMQRVFYYDSEGELDELVHRDGRFVRFAPGPQRVAGVA